MPRTSGQPLADGFYLSAYLTTPGMAYCLSTATRHDNNVSLWRKKGDTVTLERYWELERFTGIKHYGFGTADEAQASAALRQLLASTNLSMTDIRECWGTSGVSAVSVDARGLYGDIDLPYHSICHLYSAALLEGVPGVDRTVLAFAVDGGPDFDLETRPFEHWYSGGVFRNGGAELFPAESPAPLYHVATERYGMEEGTLMALAGASPRQADAAGLVGEVRDRARFFGRAAYGDAEAILDELDGLVRKQLTGVQGTPGLGLDAELHVVSAVMKHVQDMTETVMRRNVETALGHYHLDPRTTELALAGGYALNCPTNSHLMNHYGFRQLLAPPCVNDSGQSLGIGLATIAARSGFFDFRFPGAFLGERDNQLETALNEYAPYVFDTRPANPEHVVRDLAHTPVAWVNGRAELGPRALGNRSLLADPTNPAAKDRLNEIKGRQPWRPVAPVVLAERAGAWFDHARPSPYMLETFTGTARTRTAAPAVLHLDGTARVQTVYAHDNPDLHAILAQFEAVTGVPILCNTSLNDKGEPIAQSAGEAFNFCLRKGLPVVYVNGTRVHLDPTGFTATRPARRPLADMAAPTPDAPALHHRCNPHGLDDLHLNLWLRVPELRHTFDPTRCEDLDRLRDAADTWLHANPCTLSWWGTGFAHRAEHLDSLDHQGFALGIGRFWSRAG